ncbi:MAG: hypothetical protein DRN20_02280 [Thermoplasmata archaeon]|nr:MAG: hypothetical protein DRN20_02280 [Thermoplasmata archaeon]
MPIFDDVGRLFGTIVYEERGGKKKIFFRMRDSTIIDVPNLPKFLEFLRKNEIPDEEINKALRFFNKHMLGMMF